MSTSHRPTAAEDFAGYLRTYHADALDGSEPVEEVWDRYHLPDGTHLVNGRVWDRGRIMGSLRSRRSLNAPYELYVHEVIVEGSRAAARYTISTPMLGKIQNATEAAVFAELAEDGRVAGSTAFSVTRTGWSGPGRDDPFDLEWETLDAEFGPRRVSPPRRRPPRGRNRRRPRIPHTMCGPTTPPDTTRRCPSPRRTTASTHRTRCTRSGGR